MTAAELLAALTGRGVRVYLEGGRLRFQAPLGAGLSVRQLKALRAVEHEAAAMLAADPTMGLPLAASELAGVGPGGEMGGRP